MKYTIYKITNKINGKIYIGKHQTQDIDDGYMGSGKRLKHSIAKYGIESFTKEILFVFDTEEEMNQKERELVTEDFCSREDTYNICMGGNGGFGYINSTTSIFSNRNPKPGYFAARLWEKSGFTGKSHSSETRQKISSKLKGKPPTSGMLGKNHSEESKVKMSETRKGQNNGSYGTMWITDGVCNKKINKDECVPDGWYKGRNIHKNLSKH